MKKELIAELNYPPSLNSYYKHARNRIYISDAGRKYHEHVKNTLTGLSDFKTGDLEIIIELYPPDLRKRDVDNVLKCLLDSITRSQNWTDDSQIKKLTIERFFKVKGGLCKIKITEF
jgi:crossover junction endodeoxyribonuclease RusA